MADCSRYTPLRVILKPLSFEPILAAHDWDVAMGEKAWPLRRRVKDAIFSRDNRCCYYCGSPFRLSVDHKVPQKVGGSHRSSNLVTACFSCNGSKGAKRLNDFIRDRFHGDAA